MNTKTTSTQIFAAEPGEENSLTIFRVAGIKMQIGFISSYGEFFMDTKGEQIMIEPEDMKILWKVVEYHADKLRS